jgi:hypothetical protein
MTSRCGITLLKGRKGAVFSVSQLRDRPPMLLQIGIDKNTRNQNVVDDNVRTIRKVAAFYLIVKPTRHAHESTNTISANQMRSSQLLWAMGKFECSAESPPLIGSYYAALGLHLN